jgi:hypothetical protein
MMRVTTEAPGHRKLACEPSSGEAEGDGVGPGTGGLRRGAAGEWTILSTCSASVGSSGYPVARAIRRAPLAPGTLQERDAMPEKRWSSDRERVFSEIAALKPL